MTNFKQLAVTITDSTHSLSFALNELQEALDDSTFPLSELIEHSDVVKRLNEHLNHLHSVLDLVKPAVEIVGE